MAINDSTTMLDNTAQGFCARYEQSRHALPSIIINHNWNNFFRVQTLLLWGTVTCRLSSDIWL